MANKLFTKRLNKRQAIFARYLIAIILSIPFIIYAVWRSNSLKRNARYTIGITGDTFLTTMSGTQIEYSYIVQYNNYRHSENYLNDTIKSGCQCRFYVKYDVKHPKISELLQNKPVPDSVKSAPPNGWDKIPGE